jgi:hypothetical protein
VNVILGISLRMHLFQIRQNLLTLLSTSVTALNGDIDHLTLLQATYSAVSVLNLLMSAEIR